MKQEPLVSDVSCSLFPICSLLRNPLFPLYISIITFFPDWYLNQLYEFFSVKVPSCELATQLNTDRNMQQLSNVGHSFSHS